MAALGRSGGLRALAVAGAALLFATGFTHVERVTVSRTGGQATYGGNVVDLSRDGRFALVTSFSPLDQADASGVDSFQAFRRDNLTGRVIKVAIGPGAAEGGSSTTMSASGRVVAFTRRGDPGNKERLYVRDLPTATTTHESVLTDGTPIESNQLTNVRISRDGRYVAFTAGSDPYGYRLYWRDRVAGTTHVLGPTGSYSGVLLSGDGLHLIGTAGCFHCPGEPVSYDFGGVNGVTYAVPPGTGNSSWHDITDNGRYLVTGGRRYDRVLGMFDDAPGPPVTWPGESSISGDGRFVTFSTLNAAWLPNPPPPATPEDRRLYLWDTASSFVRLLDRNATGQHPNYPFEGGAVPLTRTGRYAGFTITAGNLVANDTNGFPDGFLVDAAVPRPIETSTSRPRGASNVPVVVRGGFLLPDAIADFGPGITVLRSQRAANGGVRFYITIAPNASRGLRDVRIANPGVFGLAEGGCNDCFRVR